jgi:hypothetical protein
LPQRQRAEHRGSKQHNTIGADYSALPCPSDGAPCLSLPARYHILQRHHSTFRYPTLPTLASHHPALPRPRTGQLCPRATRPSDTWPPPRNTAHHLTSPLQHTAARYSTDALAGRTGPSLAVARPCVTQLCPRRGSPCPGRPQRREGLRRLASARLYLAPQHQCVSDTAAALKVAFHYRYGAGRAGPNLAAAMPDVTGPYSGHTPLSRAVP